MKIKCGNANPKGNVKLFYKGGCRKEIDIKDAYRCVGCGGYFHKECILKHFELEKKCDWGRQQEKAKIPQIIKDAYLNGWIDACQKIKERIDKIEEKK